MLRAQLSKMQEDSASSRKRDAEGKPKVTDAMKKKYRNEGAKEYAIGLAKMINNKYNLGLEVNDDEEIDMQTMVAIIDYKLGQQQKSMDDSVKVTTPDKSADHGGIESFESFSKRTRKIYDAWGWPSSSIDKMVRSQYDDMLKKKSGQGSSSGSSDSVADHSPSPKKQSVEDMSDDELRSYIESKGLPLGERDEMIASLMRDDASVAAGETD